MPRILDIKSDDLSGEIKENRGNNLRTLKLTYIVLADNLEQTEDDIRSTPGLPAIGDDIRGMRCKSIRPKETSSQAGMWEVVYRFDSRFDIESISERHLPPEARTPTWDWGLEWEEEVLEFDPQTKEPIINAVGEPIIVVDRRPIPVLTITRLQLVFNPAILMTHCNRTNSEDFWGVPENCALLETANDRGTTAQDEQGETRRYREVDYIIKFNFKRDEEGELIGWVSQPLHHGTQHYDVLPSEDPEGIGTLVPFVDSHGNPTTGNLDDDGSKLARDQAKYLTFNRKKKVNLNELNLGPFA